MPDFAAVIRRSSAPRLTGFEFTPLPGLDVGSWWRGTATASKKTVLARLADRIPFADAIRDIAILVDLQETTAAGIAAPLAVAVCAGDHRIVAAVTTSRAGFTITTDPKAAASLPADELVDVLVVYEDSGVEALAGADLEPLAAARRLTDLATILDSLAASTGGPLPPAHGSLDLPSLRIDASGPSVLAVGLDQLDLARRSRLDTVGPWHVVSPERCLSPCPAAQGSDVYGLATLWTFARTGRPPFSGDDAATVVRRKLSDSPALDGLAEPERTVVGRGLALTREQRFGSCHEFVAALTAALTTVEPPVEPPARRPTLADTTRESRATLGMAAGGDTATVSPTTATADRPTEPVTANDSPGRDDVPLIVAAHADEPQAPSPRGGVAEAEKQRSSLEVPSPALTVPLLASPATPAVTAPLEPVSPPREPAPTASTQVHVVVATHPYKAGDLILPGYRLVTRLGKGGFGEVWKAASPGGMSVAIKVIANLGRKEGAREFRALRTVKDIHHAHIVPLFGVWLKTSDGYVLNEKEAEETEAFIHKQGRGSGKILDSNTRAALENLELVIAMGLGDQTLYDRFKALGSDGLDVGKLLVWMRQAALAIDHFNRGSTRIASTGLAVQHCDIKPQNMVLVGDAVQVCDFGLARVQGEVRATANNLLSIAYAAPEMCVKPHDPSPHTDQYSLAVSYHELRTGRLPYGGGRTDESTELGPLEILRAKCDGAIDVSAVPAGEGRVIRKSLSMRPEERFGSCEEFIDALELAVERDAADPPAAPAPAAKRPIPWSRAAGLAAGVAAILGLTTYLVWPLIWPERLVPQTNPGPDPTRSTVDVAQSDKSASPENMGAKEPKDTGVVVTPTTAPPPPPPPPPPTLEPAEKAFIAAAEDGRLDESEAPTIDRLVREFRTRGGDASAAQRLLDAVAAVSRLQDAGSADIEQAAVLFDQHRETLPESFRTGLGRRLAEEFVDRARKRLQEFDVDPSEKPTSAKRRALEDSLADCGTAARFDPASWQAQGEWGRCEALLGRYAEAIGQYTRAIDLAEGRSESGSGQTQPATDKDLRDLYSRRAFALLEERRYVEAAKDYSVFKATDPQLPVNLWDMHAAAADGGDVAAAVDILQRLETVLRDRPQAPGVTRWEVCGNLAWYLACGPAADAASGGRAVILAEEALQLAPAADRGQILDTLACAHARAGNLEAAITRVEEALAATTDPATQDEFRRHKASFEAGRPWTEP